MDWKTISAYATGSVDGSTKRNYPGRPVVGRTVEQLVVRFAAENRNWGHDKIAGALANILNRHGIPPSAGVEEDQSDLIQVVGRSCHTFRTMRGRWTRLVRSREWKVFPACVSI